jgi:hypothetical protein
MVEVDHFELTVSVSTAQVCEPTSPVVMFRQPFAKVSIRSTDVEATPDTVRAVEEALVIVSRVPVSYTHLTLPTM